MISILIPIYNGIEFIEESVNSVINQTVKEWELIIGVNGHSKDSDVFKQAQTCAVRDTRIRVVHLNAIGKSQALNEMLEFVKFDWICILDVDDFWYPTKLLSQLHYTKTYDIIGTMCQYFHDSTDVPNIPVGDLKDFSFYSFNPIINSSCMVRKCLCHWEECDLEDYDMWLRLWREKRLFYNVRSVQVRHRIHSQSAFNSKGNSNHVPALIEKHKARQEALKNESERSCLPKNITFATCWYTLHSKYTSDVYERWMQNIIHHVNEFNLVIFTNEESKFLVDKYVKEKPSDRIKVVILEYNQFHSFRWKDKWIQNHTKNFSLNKITDWKINMIWSEKIHFVQSAMKIYDSEFYGWMDIGYFRDEPIPVNWPNLTKISSDKIMYAIVCDEREFGELKTIIKNENEFFLPQHPIPPEKLSVAGGFFVTNRINLIWWNDTYYTRLHQYFENEYLVKDDQMIILDCITHNEIKFELGNNEFPKHSAERWFFFRKYL
jgi:glycosyltransferase involved in cell wall biosynthesis